MSEKLTVVQKVISGATEIEGKREFAGDVGSWDKQIAPGETIFVPVCFRLADLQMLCLKASEDVRLEPVGVDVTRAKAVELVGGLVRLWQKGLPEQSPFDADVLGGLEATNLGEEPARLQVKCVS